MLWEVLVFYKFSKADPGSEFFDEEQAAVRRKIAAVKVYFDLLLLSSEMVFKFAIEDLFLLVTD